ncbi:hypothetical protein EDL96_08770 [Kocuria soli]|uniref:Uncharacterized protein n=1 Tax=Kocuria soli TaxID=2485125 RepID=A0A3N4AAV8_9MICC|nr:hypothetical protein EDL96_08770 [Kocuria soli]
MRGRQFLQEIDQPGQVVDLLSHVRCSGPGGDGDLVSSELRGFNGPIGTVLLKTANGDVRTCRAPSGLRGEGGRVSLL